MYRKRLLIGSICFGLFWLAAAAAVPAQEISFEYFYKFDYADATQPPQLTGLDLNFPEAARKNGVQGTLKASVVLGEDGKTRDIKILEGLPHGVTEAAAKALQSLYFQPAKKFGTPVAVTMHFDLVVSAVYNEEDKNVTKPVIVQKPVPIYPAKYLGEKLKGKVQVLILFLPDGHLKILNVSSVMPREFDHAAREAAAKIQFRPAVHKKSKVEVAQKVTVEFDFKP